MVNPWEQGLKPEARGRQTCFAFLASRFTLLDTSQEFSVYRGPVVRKAQVPIHMLEREKPFKLLLLANPQQLANATDDTASQSMTGRKVWVHQKHQTDRLASRLQLPGHFIGQQTSIAIPTQKVWALCLNAAHCFNVCLCHLLK